jgi:hypothetical protein
MQVGMALTPNSLARRKPGVQIRRLGIWPSRSHSCTALPGRFRVEESGKIVGVASRFYDCSGFVHAATSYRVLPLARRDVRATVERFLPMGCENSNAASELRVVAARDSVP